MQIDGKFKQYSFFLVQLPVLSQDCIHAQYVKYYYKKHLKTSTFVNRYFESSYEENRITETHSKLDRARNPSTNNQIADG